MIGAAIPMNKAVEVKEEDHVMEMIDVTEPVTSPELGPRVVKAEGKV